MTSYLIVIVTFIYTFIAFEQGLKGNAGMSMAYAGYAFSNLGLLLFVK
jgi:hypothetical protein